MTGKGVANRESGAGSPLQATARGNQPVETALLACPACRSSLAETDAGELVCTNASCPCHNTPFPVVAGQHCLIDFENSIIERHAIAARAGASPVARRPKTIAVRLVRALLQGAALSSRKNCEQFLALVKSGKERPRILVVGGGTIGIGADALYSDREVELLAFDVYASPVTRFVADAHAIPLHDETVEGVWIQAVLEHVLEPRRVADEIWRVLRPRGIVYAETPFMQQVHEGAYDFTRFTHSGHRWLFRRFVEIASGPSGGPGTAMLWSLRYLFRALFRSSRVAVAFQLPFFWLRCFDRLVDKRMTLDAASAIYFLGSKSDEALRPSDLTHYYDSRG